MGKDKSPLRQQIDRGIEVGANPNKTPRETWGDVIQTAQQDMEAASNLSNARKERKAAVALRLNQLREESGLRQRDVAVQIGVNVITLSGYEVGRSEPPEEVLVRLASLYQVSLDYLLCRTDTRIEFDEQEYRIIDADRKQLREQLENIEKQLEDIQSDVE